MGVSNYDHHASMIAERYAQDVTFKPNPQLKSKENFFFPHKQTAVPKTANHTASGDSPENSSCLELAVELADKPELESCRKKSIKKRSIPNKKKINLASARSMKGFERADCCRQPLGRS